ncbi:MAG: methyltransferase dimerization domain-containing protein [Dehalococcoidia bacterium]
MNAEPIQPATIQSITGAIPEGYALLAGLQLDLFTVLHDAPRTLDQLAAEIGCEPRRLGGLLYYLVRIGLISVTDDCFANTPEADRYLVRGQPGSFVNSTGFWTELWEAMAAIAASIRAGRALEDHDYAGLPPEERAVLYHAYDVGVRTRGLWLADTFDFTAGPPSHPAQPRSSRGSEHSHGLLPVASGRAGAGRAGRAVSHRGC